MKNSRIFTQTSNHEDWFDPNKFRFLHNWGYYERFKFTTFKLELIYE